jgi:hypothetical protein
MDLLGLVNQQKNIRTMNTKLKLAIEEAIDGALNKHSEGNLWDGYIHTELTQQMANAAEQVFDASMSGQAFAKGEES